MKSKILIIIILFSGLLNAQQNYPPIEPIEYTFKVVGSDSLKAYVFHPSNTSKIENRPSMVIFHGGGWSIGEPSWGFRKAKRFAELGLVVVVAQYRLADEKNITPIDAIEDTKDMILWMREQSAKLGIDKNKIAAYGWSAGAHLVTCSAVFAGLNSDFGISSIPNALILHSPALSVVNDGWFKKLLLERGKPIDYSPAEHLRGNLPPSIIVIGKDDTVTPLKYSKFFQKEMIKYGNVCELHVYDGVGHLFTPSNQPDSGWPKPDKKVAEKAFDEIVKFLNKYGYTK